MIDAEIRFFSSCTARVVDVDLVRLERIDASMKSIADFADLRDRPRAFVVAPSRFPDQCMDAELVLHCSPSPPSGTTAVPVHGAMRR